MSKLKFDMETMGARVPVERYSTNNGNYTFKEFTIELRVKVQGISHSGVGGHHQNGVSENTIKNLFIIVRTVMIHSSLRWTGASDNIL